MDTTTTTTRRKRVITRTTERRQATPKERNLIHLLANLGCSLAKYGLQHASSKGQIAPEDRKHLAEWHFLRLQQIRRIERSLEPVAQLKRVYYRSQLSPRSLKSLKLVWMEDEKQRVKRVNPELDELLSMVLDRGDTLKHIFHTIESRERVFSRTPIPGVGVVPLWVNEWEESGYEINFFPPSFPDWAQLVDD
ncbi:MAG: hypothetical protein QNJ68_11970 [Microcoleaceae cyanobacterium MO_207.B10]|nr:hypothetical protein [Microcoleaceae cyanobacterium MO_207.B10]